MPDDAIRHAEVCKAMILERRIVGEALGFSLVENANFDILMELYLARAERRPVFVWSLCAAANTPHSTAYRKIKELIEAGLIVRHDDRKDRRRVEVELTESGIAMIERLVCRVAAIPWPSRKQ
ncbi:MULTISPECIES: winged helix DNA-binding protein [unclassified Sphingomonas]|uniref:winged helix DNA-binding protein n=1 Tax=unclassified Sphingomonas TaxID=196159 RepID=UPI002863263C|nr:MULTISPECIES: winged helix DNA-binding protein [unclassified Sphingomonas]MDR6116595.1 DNA-binding MarR family transcriptional regulator [Sphingomonas sp. SORGH_AS_0789]MDR6149728.1 DNA-binding MarR family transcriptional regulator [Sphingomonas sp. SORGH_AS_0742]